MVLWANREIKLGILATAIFFSDGSEAFEPNGLYKAEPELKIPHVCGKSQ